MGMGTTAAAKTITSAGNYFQESVRLTSFKAAIKSLYISLCGKHLLWVIILASGIQMAQAQQYDLIVTTRHDSIACHIDSISGNKIYFEMRFDREWIHTLYDKEQVLYYKPQALNKKDVTFRRGTSYLMDPDSIRINHVNRNMAYGTASYLLYSYALTLNYERIFFINQKANKTWSYRVGGGIINTDGKFALVTLNNLRGKGKNKFEMNIGATYINEPHNFGPHYVTVVLNAGYRLQSPDKHFILRTGVGTPEGLYFSLGYSF